MKAANKALSTLGGWDIDKSVNYQRETSDQSNEETPFFPHSEEVETGWISVPEEYLVCVA